jgi:hypothetical protein
MVWSIPETAPSALWVIAGNPNAGRPPPNEDLARAARTIRRARSLAERAAIALLLGVGGYLTLLSFVSDYTNFP